MRLFSPQSMPFRVGSTARAMGEPLEVRSPYDGAGAGQTWRATEADLDEAISRAVRASSAMRCLAAAERSGILRRTAALLEERTEDFARSICAEAGKPLRDARGEASWVPPSPPATPSCSRRRAPRR